MHPDGQSNPGGAVGAGGDPLVDPVGQRCDPLRIDAARQRGVGAAERLNPGVRHGASSGPRGHQRMPAGREPASNLQVGGPGQRRSRRSVTLHRILKHQCCDHVPVTHARKGPPGRQAAPVGVGLQRGHEAAGVHQRAGHGGHPFVVRLQWSVADADLPAGVWVIVTVAAGRLGRHHLTSWHPTSDERPLGCGCRHLHGGLSGNTQVELAGSSDEC